MQPTVKITLGETIEKKKKDGITRNRIAVEGKIRPATIAELCNGKSKAISFETLTRIVDALNSLDPTGKHYEITDVLTIEYVED
ncbi:helix-turn-helix transcriptional regulator [Oceanobacillus sp. FSL K6-0118]|uniref:helix-turn-helix domain-containing protein n=1 Tax=Oceanobacillus sp. FSL K6-0118 TaxID=2921418 RepID=UPI0030FA46A2